MRIRACGFREEEVFRFALAVFSVASTLATTVTFTAMTISPALAQNDCVSAQSQFYPLGGDSQMGIQEVTLTDNCQTHYICQVRLPGGQVAVDVTPNGVPEGARSIPIPSEGRYSFQCRPR